MRKALITIAILVLVLLTITGCATREIQTVKEPVTQNTPATSPDVKIDDINTPIVPADSDVNIGDVV